MINSVMSLDDCFVKSLTIETNAIIRPDKSADRQPAKVNIAIEHTILRNDQHPLQFLIPLGIAVTWEEPHESTYKKVAIELQGFFSFPVGTAEEEIQQYVPVLCLTNLFGIARGIIAQATGNCAEGAFYLPLVNLAELLQQVAANAAAATSAPEKALELGGSMEPASPTKTQKRTRRRMHRVEEN